MEKFSVDQNQELIKSAEEKTKCECGGNLLRRGNIIWCDCCGSKCLEKLEHSVL